MNNNPCCYPFCLSIPEICDDFLRDKNGDNFNWFGHTNQVIGSYTRTTRAFFNLNDQEQEKRWIGFNEYIQNNC